MSSNRSRSSSLDKEVKPRIRSMKKAEMAPIPKQLAKNSSIPDQNIKGSGKQPRFRNRKKSCSRSCSQSSSKPRSRTPSDSQSGSAKSKSFNGSAKSIQKAENPKNQVQIKYSDASISDSGSEYSIQNIKAVKNKATVKKKLSNCSYASFASNISESYSGNQIKVLNFKEEDKHKQVVAIIISFKKGSSYDNLFTSVQQKSMQGTKVLVYSCASSFVGSLTKGFKGQFVNEEVKGLFQNIAKLDADCVVFNWECCSGYSSKKFPETSVALFEFLEIIVDKGHMAMFSDFSLKALIKQWPQQTKLGANPFKQCGQTSGHFKVNFQADILKQCPSAQLQTVGQMAENNTCNFHAMGGTIVYGVNTPPQAVESPYVLQVLTIVEKDIEAEYQCQVGEHKGAAGHVLLSYKSGGCILTSMGHWIELMKLDTTEKKFFQIAKEEYGEEYALERKRSFEQLSDDGRNSYIAKNTKKFVQNQAPCKNMERKRRNRVASQCSDSD